MLYIYLNASAELNMIWETFKGGAAIDPPVLNRLNCCRTRVWPNRNAAAANSFAIDGLV